MQATEIYEDKLYSTIRRLGENSSKSFAILKVSDESKENSIIHCNDSYLNLTKYTYAELVGQSYFTLLADNRFKIDIKELDQKLIEGKMTQIELFHHRKNSLSFYAEIELIPFQDDKLKTSFVLLFIKDITNIRVEVFFQSIEKKIYMEIEKDSSFEKKMKLICNELDLYFSPFSFTTVLMKGEEEQLRVMASDNFKIEAEEEYFKNYRLTNFYNNAMEHEGPTLIESIKFVDLIEEHKQVALKNNMKSCCLIPIRNQKKKVLGLFALYYTYINFDGNAYRPIFEKISNLISLVNTYSISQNQLHKLAYTDITTGLPNRHHFINDLDECVTTGEVGLVKILEPSEYSNIVELYGRKAGDELMRQIAKRFIENKTIKHAKIARFSSSALVVSYKLSNEELASYKVRINELLRSPYLIGDKQIYITLKIGIAPFYGTVSAEEVVRHADNALSYSRKQSGTYVSVFTEERGRALERQMEILNHLTLAIKRKEISVSLQPKVDIKNESIIGLEALARWNSPELGAISPIEFIEVAENTGKIREIDNLVIDKVLEWMHSRHLEGKKTYRVALNVSPNHFYHPAFIEDLSKMVQKYAVSPRDILIEVTENVGLVDMQKAMEIITKLKKLGFDTSVDDFGIGFSSLSYLPKLSFTELKIDRSFINKIDESGTKAVVRTIIQLANTLEMEVVAEGIETDQQANILIALGCKVGQGYKYFKPIPIEEIDKILS